MKRKVLTTSLISGALGAGFILGQGFEKWKSYNNQSLLDRLPVLPIFGTVSAAVPAPIEYPSHIPENVNETRLKVNRTAQIMKYGFPSLADVKSHQDYVLAYDKRNRVPYWVFEHMTKDTIAKNKNIDRSKCKFKEDNSIHEYFRSNNLDYKGSGFHRGHLAAAGNHRLCQEHVDETFYLSNIAPQIGPFNTDIWNDLERYVRKLARNNNNVYVCTGPLYLPSKDSDGKVYVKYQVIGANHVAVPTHFFKVIVIENKNNELEMESYVMPNQIIKKGTPLYNFQVSPESIERASGLLFFDRLSRKKLKRINNEKIH